MVLELDLQKEFTKSIRKWSDWDQVAIVHDALPFRGGAEHVLETVLELFPHAPVYTLLYNRPAFQASIIGRRQVYTSFIDSLPFARTHHRMFLPVYPFAIEQFDLSRYDLIISLSYAVAHGVLTIPDQLHIAYLHSPMRYAWQTTNLFNRGGKLRFPVTSWLAKLVFHYLRIWDRSASDRVDTYFAVSQFTSSNIWRSYRRKAQVIYPPVDIRRFNSALRRDNFYLVVSRLTNYKKVNVIVEAFSRLKLPLVIVGEGAEYARLLRIATPNIRFLKYISDKQLEDLFSRAKGLVHAAVEDFGIALVEAQAAGCPVIAFGKGGAVETVLPERTGVLYSEQSADSLTQAVEDFETNYRKFDQDELRQNATRFSKENFQTNFLNQIDLETGLFGI